MSTFPSNLKMSVETAAPDNWIDQSGRFGHENEHSMKATERAKKLRRKVDLRLCTIGALLFSLNLIDSSIISSASVTSMLQDLGLDHGNRYSLSILIFTVASVCFQLPATIAVRLLGPRIFFAFTTICFGLITLVSIEQKAKDLMLNGNSARPSSIHGDR